MRTLLLILLLIPNICFADLDTWCGVSTPATIDGVTMGSWDGIDIASGAGGGTVTYLDATSGTTNGGTSITINVPAATSDGDMMIMSIINDIDQAITLDVAWTQLGNQITSSSSRSVLAYRIANSEPASYSHTVSSSTDLAGSVCTFRKTSGTFNVTEYSSNISSTNTVTSVAVDVPANSALLCMYLNDDTISMSTPPTSMTERIDVGSSLGVTHWAWTQDYTTGADTVTKTVVVSGTSDMTLFAIVISAD